MWARIASRPSSKEPLLVLAELDDVSDGVVSDGLRGLPKLASSGGKCGLKIAVPILLKGFGTTDLERWLASSRAGAQRSGRAAGTRGLQVTAHPDSSSQRCSSPMSSGSASMRRMPLSDACSIDGPAAADPSSRATLRRSMRSVRWAITAVRSSYGIL